MAKDVEQQLAEDRMFEAERGVTPGRTRLDARTQLERAGVDLPPRPERRGRDPDDAEGEQPRPEQPAALPPLAIVVSRYNDAITGNMLRAAIEEFLARGGRDEHLSILDAFGAFELTPLAEACARSGLYAGVLCLGCIIKGETDHDTYIAHAVAQGLANVTVKHGVPCAFGVLTVNSIEQAIARAGGRDGMEPGNKGAEAMAALVETVRAKAALAEAVQSGNPRCRYRIPSVEDAAPVEPAKGPVRRSGAEYVPA